MRGTVVDGSATEVPVTLNVNGTGHDLRLEPRVSLLDALRERLGLTGTKKGCDQGACGACTVLVDGARVNACLTLAVMHEDTEITTIEGLAGGGELHPLQAAFIENDGLQCGYCTPGQILSAIAMVGELRAGMPSTVGDGTTAAAALTDAEIRERLSGNLCRCGAHNGIVAAVRQVFAREAP